MLIAADSYIPLQHVTCSCLMQHMCDHAAGSLRRRGTSRSNHLWLKRQPVSEQQAISRQQTNKCVAACATGSTGSAVGASTSWHWWACLGTALQSPLISRTQAGSACFCCSRYGRRCRPPGAVHVVGRGCGWRRHPVPGRRPRVRGSGLLLISIHATHASPQVSPRRVLPGSGLLRTYPEATQLVDNQPCVGADVQPLDVSEPDRPVVAIQYGDEAQQRLAYLYALVAAGEVSERALRLTAQVNHCVCALQASAIKCSATCCTFASDGCAASICSQLGSATRRHRR